MAPSAAALLALSVIYRLTVNLPDLPYSYDLRDPGTPGFIQTANNISSALDGLLEDVHGEHRPVVFQFRFHKEMGCMASVDIYSDEEREEVRDRILHALHKGQLGDISVSMDGFQLHVIKEANDLCSPEEFQCSDSSCIPAKERCDGHRNCEDGSDESKVFANCSHHQPVIYQTDKVLSTPRGGKVLLSAMIDLVPENHRIVWSKGGETIGNGELNLSNDDRIRVYKNGNTYYLMIDEVRDSDIGSYECRVDGFTAKAHFEVRLTADTLPEQSEECPIGEKACRSGHCIPVSQFCDRVAQCPDGDDESDCSPVECTSSEIRCHSDNVCVPSNVACDGWNDCRDGSDEMGCSSTKGLSHKHHGHHKKHSRLTVTCEDGSAPEYSLHGSSYCWSNSVCPTGTACVQGLCCSVGPNATLPRLCPSSLWQCHDGSCGHRCDGRRDCFDGDDEANCTGNEKRSVGCPDGEFACNDGSCIPEEKKCDRHYDCRDGSDETSCEYFLEVQRHHAALQSSSTGTSTTTTTSTESPEHSGKRRDHHHHPHHHDVQHQSHHEMTERVDTPLRDDEEDIEQEDIRLIHDPNSECSDQEFRCPYLRETKCVHYEKLCDGVDDCGDGSDEVNCESGSREEHLPDETTAAPVLHGSCTHMQFTCNDGRCIDKELACNRKYDCDDGSDETTCDYFKEAMTRRNNESDVRQKEDELRRREEELRHREAEELRREHEELRREQELQRREETQREHERQQEDERRREHERHAEEQRRREHHERQQEEERNRQLEEHRRREEHERQKSFSNEVTFKEEYDEELGCAAHEFQCVTGECVDRRRVCDTYRDCMDGSDEANCVEKHPAVQPQHPPQEQRECFHRGIPDNLVSQLWTCLRAA